MEKCSCKRMVKFGCFFEVNNGEIDVLVHLQETSYSRINHPDEVFHNW